MIRALVVDDSDLMREIMTRALETDPDLEVAAAAADGKEAVHMAKKYRPDVITMDIMMPRMNGLDATRVIMEETPVPIVMVCAIGDSEEQRISFEAMEAGAVWVVKKPRGQATADWDTWSRSLCQIVKSMAEVKVVSRRPSRAPRAVDVSTGVAVEKTPRVIAMAASTGGPTALKSVLEKLPEDFEIPILVCQHIARGFVEGMVEWLNFDLELPVRVGATNDAVRPGVTFAPDHGNLLVTRDERLIVQPAEGDEKYIPSADALFESVARHYKCECVGVIMTGMGTDGAAGLKKIWDEGGITVAQDEASSLIYGMPGAAVKAGGVKYKMDPEEIARMLIKLPRTEDRKAV